MEVDNGLVGKGLDRLSEGFGIFDKNLRLVTCNRPFRELRNYPRSLCQPGATLEAMLRFNAERGDFGPGDVDEQVAERMAEISETDDREIEREMADGQILKIRYQHFEPGGLTITFEDKTEERRAQAALRASEERYALVSEAAEEAIYEWEIPQDRFFTSARLTALLGVESDADGRRAWRWVDMVHPDDVGRYCAALAAHCSGEEPRWDCEYRIIDRDGACRWISDHGTSVRDENGQAVRMVAAVRDITHRVERDAALAASEERHTLVTRATSDGLYDWDVSRDVLFVSERLNQLFAFESGELTSGKWAARVHEGDIDRYIAAIRAHFKGETPNLECEYRIKDKGGDFRWVRDHGIGVRGDDGRVKRMVGAVRDVTDIRNAEAEAERAQTRLLEALESLSDGFLLVDAKERVRLWNSRYIEIFGDAAGGNISDIVKKRRPFFEMIRDGYERGMFPPHPDGADGWIARRREAWRHPAADLEIQLSNGRFIAINERRTTDGGRVALYTDVTERKKAEQVLRDSEAQLSAALQEFNAVIDTIEYGVIFMGPDLRARIINRAFCKIWDVPQTFMDSSPTMRELIEYNRYRGIYDVAPEDWDEWIERRVEAVRIGDIAPMEVHRADGKALQYQCISLPDGGRMLTYFDITELKRREADHIAARGAAEQALRDLQQAQDRLVHAEKMASLGQLTAGIAHEIKNPLNFINNFAKLSVELLDELNEVLEEQFAALAKGDREDAEDLSTTLKQNLAKIREHGRRADSIVKNMLLHSREGPSERQRVDVNALAERALNLAYHGARAENPSFNIAMSREFSSDVCEVECYPHDLMRVFLNLISNGMYAAIRRDASAGRTAAPMEPTVTVTTRTVGDNVAVEIRDNGAGVPADIQEKIFTPFFTTKPAGEGTGLGLSLSYDIVVKQHGGAMSVESEPDAFTAFVVTLPRAMPDTGPNGAPNA